MWRGRSQKLWKSRVRSQSWNFWKVGAGNFGMVRVGYFTSDSATLITRTKNNVMIHDTNLPMNEMECHFQICHSNWCSLKLKCKNISISQFSWQSCFLHVGVTPGSKYLITFSMETVLESKCAQMMKTFSEFLYHKTFNKWMLTKGCSIKCWLHLQFFACVAFAGQCGHPYQRKLFCDNKTIISVIFLRF